MAVEQVGELFIGKEAITLAVHEGIDRGLVERLVAEALDLVEESALPNSQSQGHSSLPSRTTVL